ncbi:two-partner secretion domain-containing protein [Tumidithrix helvetica]|uniref:two-partner secretion domain-containing protein n=1 Tax=Tumidithrix helvetica TaxID=3457545 RepID=UPI003CC5F5E2
MNNVSMIFLRTYHSKYPNLALQAIANGVLALGLSFVGNLLCKPSIASAQPVSDSTTGTLVTPNLTINGIPSDRIDGGTQRVNNLFHSFSRFDVAGGRGVYFSNPANVANIFARVTGGTASTILGRLGVLGNANLFLLNPQGILFGPNSSLDLNGSLFVTSADRIHFADGTTFSAVNPEPSSLLTSSIPVGLGFGSNPGRIVVQGLGNQLVTQSIYSPINTATSPDGLKVQPGKTIALIGGDILLDRGILTAPNGKIELGSVRGGIVGLNPDTTLNYSNIISFGNIETRSAAGLNASGLIQLQAENMYLRGSDILSQNFSNLPAGNIILNATGSIEAGNIRSEIFGSGAGSSILISAKHLAIANGTGIATRSYSNANGGNISFNISDSFSIDGFSASALGNNIVTSTVNSLSFANGKSGDLSVSTKQFQILNGGIFTTTAVGTGNGGNINIQADSIKLQGFVPTLFIPSAISASTLTLGNAGNVTINTRLLSVLDGGRLDASTAAVGSAGSLTVNASEQILVSGTVPNSRNPSLIISSANALDPSLQQLIGVTLPLVGNSGELTINTPKLEVTNGARVSVSNDGMGVAGNLSVNANTILVSDRGSITAATALGRGGNINLQVRDLLLLRGGQILATAGGTGNGGNITIDAGLIVGVEGSQINANAFMGTGGNIFIRAQGLFFTPDSSITASSTLGISGIVSVSNLDLTSKNAFVSPSLEFVKVDTLVSNSCLAKRNATQGSFVVTGAGGLPDNPYNRFVGGYPVTPIQPIPDLASSLSPSTNPNSLNPNSLSPSSLPPNSLKNPQDNRQWQPGDPIVEVRGLAKTSSGEILPVVSYAEAIALLCPPNPKNPSPATKN